MTIKEFIEKAIEGGWDNQGFSAMTWANGNSLYEILLDPKAWEAIGKVEIKNGKIEKWEFVSNEYGVAMEAWKIKMHAMIDALVEGKSLEDFIKTL